MLTKTDLQEMLLMVEALIRRCARKQELGSSWRAYLQTRKRWLTQLIAHYED